MTTGYVYNPIYLEHAQPGHPERPERLRRVMSLLTQRHTLSQLVSLEPEALSMAFLASVHTEGHVQQVREKAAAGGGHFDADTYTNRRSYDAALHAAGGAVGLARAVLEGEVDNGFALVRPPGHHATPARAMGFCLFNNVALAARYALERAGLERVLIVDFDVHHGNGTQEIFYGDPNVLFFSLHQYPFYPGTGHWEEVGEGPGGGLTVNVPLRAGVGDDGYKRAFDEILYPLAERFQPQLVLVSAGFDAHWRDPLAGMRLSIAGYAYLARTLKSLADDWCEGRLVFTLEGGYDLEALSYGVLACLDVLLDREKVDDPFGPAPGGEPSVEALMIHLKGIHRLV